VVEARSSVRESTLFARKPKTLVRVLDVWKTRPPHVFFLKFFFFSFVTNGCRRTRMWAHPVLTHTSAIGSRAGLGTEWVWLGGPWRAWCPSRGRRDCCGGRCQHPDEHVRSSAPWSQYQRPVKVVDQSYRLRGWVRNMAGSFYGERYSPSEMVRHALIFFPALAEAFGVGGLITQRSRLKDTAEAFAIRSALIDDTGSPRNENCYPMVRLAPTSTQMVGLPSHQNFVDRTHPYRACVSVRFDTVQPPISTVQLWRQL